MKKILAPLVLAAGLPTVAAADVQVYGKGNVSLQHADETGDSKVELVSNNSRIGVKGSEALTEGLEAFFQFEYKTSIDDGNAGGGETFTQRDIYVGLRGKAGTLLAGRMNTPLKRAQNKVDLFNDLEGDINYLFLGENRVSNQLQYRSPVMGEYFSGEVAYITYETDGVDPGVSASASYKGGPLYLAVAMDQDVSIADSDTVRLVARYSFSAVHIGALYETTDSGSVEIDGALVSVLWNLNERWDLKAQAGNSDLSSDTPSASDLGDGDSFSLGADYRLSDRTKLFGYYTNETLNLACGGVSDPTDCDDEYLGVGMELKF